MIKKTACYTDIHFGKKQNNKKHNQDCLDFTKWFCDEVKNDPSITDIVFLGDYFENRAQVNVETLNMAYEGAKMVNELGLPVYFIIGNHDLYRRNTRDIFSTAFFDEFDNFILVSEPMVTDCKVGFFPFLFHDEYPENAKLLNSCDYVYGHFEFKGFSITGYNTIMKEGPDATAFSSPKRILAGHFHKRQEQKNVTYIGNTFPMDYGDAYDEDRGMAVLDHTNNKIVFKNYEGPQYIKPNLSDLISEKVSVKDNMFIDCKVDIDISYTEAQKIKEAYFESYDLREFKLDETSNLRDALVSDEIEDIDASMSIDDTVVESLTNMEETQSINNAFLVKTYMEL